MNFDNKKSLGNAVIWRVNKVFEIRYFLIDICLSYDTCVFVAYFKASLSF